MLRLKTDKRQQLAHPTGSIGRRHVVRLERFGQDVANRQARVE